MGIRVDCQVAEADAIKDQHGAVSNYAEQLFEVWVSIKGKGAGDPGGLIF